MSVDEIIIDRLSDSRWNDGRDLRLEALEKEPQAYSSTFEEEVELTESEWITRNRNAMYAFINDEPVGMIVMIIQDNPMTKHVANIFGVYVKKSHRELGIGSRLIEQAIKELSKNDQVVKIKLSVNTEQTAAVILYEKHGFKVVGNQEKEFYFNDRFYDDLLMELHL